MCVANGLKCDTVVLLATGKNQGAEMAKNTKLTKPGMSTLKVVAAAGGTFNGWAGQKGFYTLSVGKLIRDGYLADVPDCQGCTDYADGKTEQLICERPLHNQGPQRAACYNRVQITDAGRRAIAAD